MQISIKSKGTFEIKLKNLKDIKIFIGDNMVGKTYLLEKMDEVIESLNLSLISLRHFLRRELEERNFLNTLLKIKQKSMFLNEGAKNSLNNLSLKYFKNENNPLKSYDLTLEMRMRNVDFILSPELFYKIEKHLNHQTNNILDKGILFDIKFDIEDREKMIQNTKNKLAKSLDYGINEERIIWGSLFKEVRELIFGNVGTFRGRGMDTIFLNTERILTHEFKTLKKISRMMGYTRKKSFQKLLNFERKNKEIFFHENGEEYIFEQLSSGYKSFASIAVATESNIKTILLDEPESHLSMSSQIKLVNHILNVDKTFILASHSEEFVKQMFIINEDKRKLDIYYISKDENGKLLIFEGVDKAGEYFDKQNSRLIF